MRTFRRRLRRAAASFWFIPAALMVAAVLLAEVLVGLDRAFVGQGIAELPFVNAVGSSGSRDLLAAIGGSMLGVAATSFSITISVIATASSSYGPRLVRNFMADRRNQCVLGTFGATFVYALLVLRTVRSASSAEVEFVPHLAVTFAIGLAVLDVALLIYFIHHIADSIQIPTLAAGVLRDLRHSVAHRAEHPTEISTDSPSNPLPAQTPDLTVRATRAGFVQHIEHGALAELVAEADGLAHVRVRPGDHVLAGDPLVRFWHAGRAGGDGRVQGAADGLGQRLRRQITVGRDRVPGQDERHAVQQVTELAVRALSTGINDPFTAINAVVELGTGLVDVVGQPDPGEVREFAGTPRLVAPVVPAVELVDLAFDYLRGFAVGSTEVVLALLEQLSLLAAHSDRSDVRSALHEQRTALLRRFAATGPDERDQHRVDTFATLGAGRVQPVSSP